MVRTAMPLFRRIRTAGLYLRAIVFEFRWTLLGLAFVLALGTFLYLHTPSEFETHPRTFLNALFATWMAMLAQPINSPPTTWYLNLLCGFYPVIGFVLIGEGVVRLALLMISKRRGEKEWMTVLASTYRDHVVLCGLGHLGYRVLEQLMHGGVPVVVLEKVADNPFVTQARAFKVPILIRDMKEDQALIDAGIQRAGAVIICSNDDISNLEVAIDSRRMNPKIRIVMRLFDQQLASKIAGALTVDAAFSSSALAAPVVAAMSLHTSVLSSMSLDGTTYVAAEVFVEDSSKLVGKTVAAIEGQFGLKVLARRAHGAAAQNVGGHVAVAAGDTLIVHTAAEHLAEIASAGGRKK